MAPYCGGVLAIFPTPYPRTGAAAPGRSQLPAPWSGLSQGMTVGEKHPEGHQGQCCPLGQEETGSLVTLEKPMRRGKLQFWQDLGPRIRVRTGSGPRCSQGLHAGQPRPLTLFSTSTHTQPLGPGGQAEPPCTAAREVHCTRIQARGERRLKSRAHSTHQAWPEGRPTVHQGACAWGRACPLLPCPQPLQ